MRSRAAVSRVVRSWIGPSYLLRSDLSCVTPVHLGEPGVDLGKEAAQRGDRPVKHPVGTCASWLLRCSSKIPVMLDLDSGHVGQDRAWKIVHRLPIDSLT